jgi:hypothetical protein
MPAFFALLFIPTFLQAQHHVEHASRHVGHLKDRRIFMPCNCIYDGVSCNTNELGALRCSQRGQTRYQARWKPNEIGGLAEVI